MAFSPMFTEANETMTPKVDTTVPVSPIVPVAKAETGFNVGFAVKFSPTVPKPLEINKFPLLKFEKLSVAAFILKDPILLERTGSRVENSVPTTEITEPTTEARTGSKILEAFESSLSVPKPFELTEPTVRETIPKTGFNMFPEETEIIGANVCATEEVSPTVLVPTEIIGETVEFVIPENFSNPIAEQFTFPKVKVQTPENISLPEAEETIELSAVLAVPFSPKFTEPEEIIGFTVEFPDATGPKLTFAEDVIKPRAEEATPEINSVPDAEQITGFTVEDIIPTK